MTNKQRIAIGIEECNDNIKRCQSQIDALQEKINELHEEQDENKIRIGELEGWLLEINEEDGEDPFTW